MRTSDVGTLLGLNQATLPSSKGSEQPVLHVEDSDLNEALNYEELLARNGYQTGNLDDDLNAAGWSAPIVNANGETFDAS